MKLKNKKLTMNYSIDPRICPQDHVCPLIQICPARAISQDQYGLPIIDDAKCIKCGKCVRRCPMHAVIKK